MDLLTLISQRRSERKYADRPIEQEKLHYILECARLAPSAVNYQPWQFIVIKNKEVQKELHASYPREWFKKAPLYIVACGDLNQSWKRSDNKDHLDIDVAIAVEHILLAITEQGLGGCWVCNFDVEICKKVLGLSDNLVPIAIIPLGYTEEAQTKPMIRKSLEEIVRTIG